MKAYKLPANRQTAIDMFLKMAAPGKMFILQTIHDDWCRAIKTQRDTDCSPTCQPEHYVLELEDGDSPALLSEVLGPPQGGLN